ncbi:hypothetical protein [Bacillus thuringiensis]|uniref:hypothetical protein n=1 Tax=Bacillus thuringiensis TaxID=1428 RepID=UPI00115B6F5F|nr:hypothetical protein [Bacillus thuringiensis]
MLSESPEKRSPNYTYIFPISLIVALCGGIGIALIKEYFDCKLYTEENAERVTGVSSISSVKWD